jgi:hypothetical protein
MRRTERGWRELCSSSFAAVDELPDLEKLGVNWEFVLQLPDLEKLEVNWELECS